MFRSPDQQDPTARSPSRLALSRGALVLSLAALLAGLGLTALSARWQQRAADAELAGAQSEMAGRTLAAIERQLNSEAWVLRALQSLFQASETVGAREFAVAFDALDPRSGFPGLQAIAYARRVPAENAAGPAADRYLIEMVAPIEGNQALFGLDAATQAPNLAAIEDSRDRDAAVLSQPFALVQFGGAASGEGVVLRLPVFSPGPLPRTLRERRQRMVGSLAMSFRVSELIGSALGPDLLRAFEIRVLDRVGSGSAVLYDSRSPDAAGAGGDAWIVHELSFGGRRWQVDLSPLPEYWAVSPTGRWAGFGMGVLSSVLLALLILVLAGTRARALAMAEGLSAQYRDSESRFRALNELLPALVLGVERDQARLRYANRAARTRLGLSESGLGGPLAPRLRDLLADPADCDRVLRVPEQAPGSMLGIQTRMIDAAGREFPVNLAASAIEIAGEQRVLMVATDTSELHRLNERLRHQATHDALTGLINRTHFERRLDELLEQVNHGVVRGALLYIDLDQFKIINDTSGHYAGDQLLAGLAQQLAQALKTGDVLARLGGDEFGVLLYNVDEAAALAVAERVRAAIDGYVFGWDGHSYSFTASVGLVLIDRPGCTRRELFAWADAACYQAKERGRNRIQRYSETDTESVQRRTEMEWAARLRKALDEGRFALDYQELMDLRAHRLHQGAHIELLLRLIDEDGKQVPPGAFIPAAERYGVMPMIDRWVVRTALGNFDRLHPDGERLEFCAINLSGASVDDQAFAEYVLQLLDTHQVPPHKLCFEITETTAVSNVAQVVRFMQRLRARGCRFALDDFGSGMASFGYLKNLPLDLLKIDGSFIRNLEADATAYSIVRAVTDIGHQMGLEVIAEWVNSERAINLLRGLGVDYVQGFSVHRPQPAPLYR